MDEDNMDNLGFKDLAPSSSGTTKATGDTRGAEGIVSSAKAGVGSPTDEHNRGAGAGSAHANGQVSRQASSYAGDSQGGSSGGRLV